MIAEVGGNFLELAHIVESEAAAFADRTAVARGVAASIIHGLNGDPDEIYGACVGTLALAIEWDIDPSGARLVLQNILADAP